MTVMLVPYLLAIWALAKETREVFAVIDEEEFDHYSTMITRLEKVGDFPPHEPNLFGQFLL
jgi:hypothetical protein